MANIIAISYKKELELTTVSTAVGNFLLIGKATYGSGFLAINNFADDNQDIEDSINYAWSKSVIKYEESYSDDCESFDDCDESQSDIWAQRNGY